VLFFSGVSRSGCLLNRGAAAAVFVGVARSPSDVCFSRGSRVDRKQLSRLLWVLGCCACQVCTQAVCACQFATACCTNECRAMQRGCCLQHTPRMLYHSLGAAQSG
jgi:hypothetical protein